LVINDACTTLTLATFDGTNNLLLANLGDSRATVVTPRGVTYQTSDECQALNSGFENYISSGIFAKRVFQEPTITKIPGERVPTGSLIVLTTDGIHGDKPNQRIQIPEIIWENMNYNPQHIANKLADHAIKHDDRAVVVAIV
jgi:serine/threonine protein phosphatase PrpC